MQSLYAAKLVNPHYRHSGPLTTRYLSSTRNRRNLEMSVGNYGIRSHLESFPTSRGIFGAIRMRFNMSNMYSRCNYAPGFLANLTSPIISRFSIAPPLSSSSSIAFWDGMFGGGSICPVQMESLNIPRA